MKNKYYAVLYIILLSLSTILSFYIPEQAAAEETIVIPKEAIRLRILANSDSDEDQQIKRAVRDEVNANITEWVKDLTSLEEARKVITSHLPEMEEIGERYVEERGLNQEVSVRFGKAQFPTKLYGQYLYPAGDYEAIIIEIGEAKGANWWCVLFPPLCFLDFSNGTAVSMSPVEEDEAEPAKAKEIGTDVKAEEEAGELEEVPADDEQEYDESEAAEEEVYVTEEDEEVVEKKLFVVELWKGLMEE